jgi:hypothetical protein
MMNIETTHVDVPEVREVFADNTRMVTFTGTEVHIEFCVTRLNEMKPPKPPTGKSYTAARIVSTPPAALQLHANLTNLVAMLEQKGMVQKAPIVPTPPTAAH